MTPATIDFSNFLSGSDGERSATATALVDSFKKTGFVKLVNHGISLQMIQKAEQQNRSFFELNDKDKLRCLNTPSPNPQRGWSSKGAESTASLRNGGNKRLTDEKENFDIGSADDIQYPNKWIEDVLPGFQAFSESFYDVCQGLCLKLMTACEQGLEIEAGSLVHRCKPASSEIRYNYYPAVAVERLLKGDTQRGWPHTDFGLITLLFQDAQGGLQYEDRSHPGRFLPLDKEVPGEIIVNISDTFERWTNGTVRAGVHQVWLPDGSDLGPRGGDGYELPVRISTVFFFKAHRDAMVGALPQFITPSTPCQYEDISALEFHKRMTSALLREAS